MINGPQTRAFFKDQPHGKHCKFNELREKKQMKTKRIPFEQLNMIKFRNYGSKRQLKAAITQFKRHAYNYFEVDTQRNKLMLAIWPEGINKTKIVYLKKAV